MTRRENVTPTDAPGPRRAEDLFAGRPAPYALFLAVKSLIESIGPVEICVTKTQVAFQGKRQFAWVWLPQMWVQRPKDGIAFSFAARDRITDPRIVEAVEPYPGRWMHHILVERASDLDEQVRAWATEAYHFGMGR